MVFYGGELSKRIQLGVIPADRLLVPAREILPILKDKAADCLVLDSGNALAVNYTGRIVFIGDNPEFNADLEDRLNIQQCIPMKPDYDNFFLEVPNFRYSIWCPQAVGAANRGRALWICPNKLVDNKIVNASKIENWNSMTLIIEFRPKRKAVLEVQEVLLNWHAEASTAGIADEKLLPHFSMTEFDWGVSVEIGAPDEITYTLIDCYLRLHSRTRIRPMNIHVLNR